MLASISECVMGREKSQQVCRTAPARNKSRSKDCQATFIVRWPCSESGKTRKTFMLGKVGGSRRRGRQRSRSFEGITEGTRVMLWEPIEAVRYRHY